MLALLPFMLVPTVARLSDGEVDDARVLAAFSTLTAEEVEGFSRTLAEGFPRAAPEQHRRVQLALGLEGVEPTALAALPAMEPPLAFDPEVHAPAQVIERHLLDPTDPRVAEVRKTLRVPERRLDTAFVYRYGAARIERGPSFADPARVLANALAGFGPLADLAEARIEALLDDGAQRAALAAFEHAYTDREGNVYPGLTLFDAWSSGAQVEVPDVDSLGIVHEVLGESDRFVAPVSAEDHGDLYRVIATIFAPAELHADLRRALARTFLSGHPTLPSDLAHHGESLHALWSDCGDDPAELLERIPDGPDRAFFLGDWNLQTAKDAQLLVAGAERAATMAAEGPALRELAVSILDELGAFERIVSDD